VISFEYGITNLRFSLQLGRDLMIIRSKKFDGSAADMVGIDRSGGVSPLSLTALIIKISLFHAC
jgi:hypothetical protein